MADVALLAAGGADSPLSYLVPGATAIRIKQVHVKYVDNGAGVAWLPAVRIVSDSNHTMGLAADQGVKVTAGSDADVSFFPGVKPATPAVSAVAQVTFCYMPPVAPKNCPITSVTPMDGDNTGFYTNDAAFFGQTTIVIAGTTYHGINLLAPGHIILMATMIPFGAITAGVDYSIELATANDGDESSFTLAPSRRIALATDQVDSQILMLSNLQTVGDFYVPPIGAVIFRIRNANAVSAFSASVGVLAVRLDSDNTFLG